jgi:hypothetical protein
MQESNNAVFIDMHSLNMLKYEPIQIIHVSFVWFIVFNATFNNISVTSWQSVLLVEETRAPRENHRPVASH